MNYELKNIDKAVVLKALYERAKYIERDIPLEAFRDVLPEEGDIRIGELFGKKLDISFTGDSVCLDDFEKEYGESSYIIEQVKESKKADEEFVKKLIDYISEEEALANRYLFKINDDVKFISRELKFSDKLRLSSIARSVNMDPDNLTLKLTTQRKGDNDLIVSAYIRSKRKDLFEIEELIVENYSNDDICTVKSVSIFKDDTELKDQKVFSCSIVDLLR